MFNVYFKFLTQYDINVKPHVSLLTKGYCTLVSQSQELEYVQLNTVKTAGKKKGSFGGSLPSLAGGNVGTHRGEIG